jgi:nitrilase
VIGTVFGDGGGSSLHNVTEIEGVRRVGALSCWEHTQPLLKYHTVSLREEIHVAACPPIHPFSKEKEVLYSMTAESTPPILSSHPVSGSRKEEVKY